MLTHRSTSRFVSFNKIDTGRLLLEKNILFLSLHRAHTPAAQTSPRSFLCGPMKVPSSSDQVRMRSPRLPRSCSGYKEPAKIFLRTYNLTWCDLLFLRPQKHTIGILPGPCNLDKLEPPVLESCQPTLAKRKSWLSSGSLVSIKPEFHPLLLCDAWVYMRMHMKNHRSPSISIWSPPFIYRGKGNLLKKERSLKGRNFRRCFLPIYLASYPFFIFGKKS